MEENDRDFLKKVDTLADQAENLYRQFKVRQASQTIMELAQLGNGYFDSKQPWKDAKQLSTRPRMQTTLLCCLYCLKALALISLPIIPSAAKKLVEMLGEQLQEVYQLGWRQFLQKPVMQGKQLAPPTILFTRIEEEAIATELKELNQLALAASKKKEPMQKEILPLKEEIEISEVKKLDLRVGLILKAEKVAKSKKLLKLLVDIGIEKRVIVSGIANNYSPEEIIGKKVVVVVNLKPATLMGIKSQGMILAGGSGLEMELLSVQQLKVGEEVS